MTNYRIEIDEMGCMGEIHRNNLKKEGVLNIIQGMIDDESIPTGEQTVIHVTVNSDRTVKVVGKVMTYDDSENEVWTSF